MLGWFGNVFILWFLYTVADGERKAYVFSIIGSILWLGQSLILQDPALIGLQIVIIGINGKNYIYFDEKT